MRDGTALLNLLLVDCYYILGIRTLARWLCGMGPQGEDLLKPMVIRDGTAGSRDSYLVVV